MQLPWTAVIVKALGSLAVLLDLDQANPSTDRVDRARAAIEEIARSDRLPVQQVFDRSIERGLPQRPPIDVDLGSQRDRRVWLGSQDQPAFVLTARQTR